MRCPFVQCPASSSSVDNGSLCLNALHIQTVLQIRPASEAVPSCDDVLGVGESHMRGAFEDVRGAVSLHRSDIVSLQCSQECSCFLLYCFEIRVHRQGTMHPRTSSTFLTSQRGRVAVRTRIPESEGSDRASISHVRERSTARRDSLWPMACRGM